MMNAPKIALIYDGDCPVCTAYCKVVTLRAIDPNFQIINARDHHPLLDKVRAHGLDMDEGFVLNIDDEFYHGAEAIHVLASITSQSGFLNKLNFMVFRSRRLSFFLYPFLRSGRNALLWILGKKKLRAV